MKITHLQLNSSTLRDPEAIVEFIKEKNVDLAFIQEVCYPSKSVNPLKEFLGDQYHYEEGIHFHYVSKNQKLAVGIISKWPIIDKLCIYYNSEDYQPKEILDDPRFSGELINDSGKNEFPASRGVKHSLKSRCILVCLIETPQGLIRAISTHFTVSDLCTEILPMYEMSLLVNSLVKHSKELPTIFSGDLNIRAKSYSVAKISEILTCHSEDLKDTLSNNHIAKQKDFPEGLAVDHVFSKGLKHIKTESIDVVFSDHKAILSNFNYE